VGAEDRGDGPDPELAGLIGQARGEQAGREGVASERDPAGTPGAQPPDGFAQVGCGRDEAGLDDDVTRLVTAYLVQRNPGESFASWVGRSDDDVLRGAEEELPVSS
jgi:sulfite reductase (ferredoxin)